MQSALSSPIEIPVDARGIEAPPRGSGFAQPLSQVVPVHEGDSVYLSNSLFEPSPQNYNRLHPHPYPGGTFNALLELVARGTHLGKNPVVKGRDVWVFEPLKMHPGLVDGNSSCAVLCVEEEHAWGADRNVIDICSILPSKVVPDAPCPSGEFAEHLGGLPLPLSAPPPIRDAGRRGVPDP